MTRTLLGAAQLAAAIVLVLMLRPRNGRERLIVRFPGAWIVVGLLLTFWIGSAVALIASEILAK